MIMVKSPEEVAKMMIGDLAMRLQMALQRIEDLENQLGIQKEHEPQKSNGKADEAQP
jgi:hypothetical protein